MIRSGKFPRNLNFSWGKYFTKFRKDRAKIVDFLLIAKFWGCALFLIQILITINAYKNHSTLHIFDHFFMPIIIQDLKPGKPENAPITLRLMNKKWNQNRFKICVWYLFLFQYDNYKSVIIRVHQMIKFKYQQSLEIWHLTMHSIWGRSKITFCHEGGWMVIKINYYKFIEVFIY